MACGLHPCRALTWSESSWKQTRLWLPAPAWQEQGVKGCWNAARLLQRAISDCATQSTMDPLFRKGVPGKSEKAASGSAAAASGGGASGRPKTEKCGPASLRPPARQIGDGGG